jgi:DNA-binding XRE family transcriptional regulator
MLFLSFRLCKRAARPVMLIYVSLFHKNEPHVRKLTREDRALGERIQLLRRKRELTQEELSERLGKNASYIAYIETHRRGLSLPMVYKIARVLKVKLRDLFDF